MKNADTTVYNIMFPLWMMLFFPPIILGVIVVNFAIDAAIIWLYLRRKAPEVIGTAVSSAGIWLYVVTAVVFGFVADVIGGVLILVCAVNVPDRYFDEYAIWTSPQSVLIHLCIIGIVGLLIFLFHRRFATRLGLSRAQARGLALIMGIVTAPWVFLVPSIMPK